MKEDIVQKDIAKEMGIVFKTQIGLILVLILLFMVGYLLETFNTKFQLGTLLFAIVLGSLGASISLMLRIQKSENPFIDLMKSDKTVSILMPILYGTLMSGIAYLLFMSKILYGIDLTQEAGQEAQGLLVSNLFPVFSTPEGSNSVIQNFMDMKPKDMQNTGKLLLWCFLAGYSESFVTGILKQLEKRASSEA